jgi:hypothetical protein
MDLVELLGVMSSPLDERLQDGPQAFAKRGEPVLDPLTLPRAGLPKVRIGWSGNIDRIEADAVKVGDAAQTAMIPRPQSGPSR